MPTYAGKEWNTNQELLGLIERNPKSALETFTVIAYYGDEDPAHHSLDIRRTGGFGDLDDTGVLAYEDLLVALVRCVGSDYIDYAATAGVTVDMVRLELEATWDVRGGFRPFGIKAPASATVGWTSLTVRAEVQSSASKQAVQKAHKVVWDNNIAAASLASIPTTHEVTLKAPPSSPPAARTARGNRPGKKAVATVY